MKKIKLLLGLLTLCIASDEAYSQIDKYSIPSVTEYFLSFGDDRVLRPNTTPFSINMVLNGDPKTRLGFCWFTNDIAENENSVVQIIAKSNAKEEDFVNPIEFNALGEKVSLNYLNAKKNEMVSDYLNFAFPKYVGVPNPETREYISHKALAENLTPDTEYSFRVGKPGAWSSIGSFRTAPNTSSFTFNYTTDTQANTPMMFDVSQYTVTKAMEMFPNARFNLNTGDFIETSSTSTTKSSSSEWEWERWFATMQNHWMKIPIVPVLGNHDVSIVDKNFFRHFNTDDSYNRENPSFATKIDGTNYSFVYGNALFIILNYEEYRTPGYLDHLGNWISEQVAKYPDVKWRFLASHRNIYTGASHHAKADLKTIREAMISYIDKNDIDFYFQGHDHVYEVIGPVYDKKLVPNAVTDIKEVPGGTRANMTGKEGGIYNVQKGTVYMVNNSAGVKKYSPKTEAEMKSFESVTGVPDYFSLFTGRLGQTDEPTFSNVVVTDESMKITTYAVNEKGEAYLFDEIKVIKQDDTLGTDTVSKSGKSDISVYPVPVTDVLNINAENVHQADVYGLDGKLILSTNTNKIDVRNLNRGVYVVRVIQTNGATSNHKIIVK